MAERNRKRTKKIAKNKGREREREEVEGREGWG
jgi:hypothetical protein